ncbi:MAG: transposase, family, partial [Francisellaceae bacterium]|nr:transposase, family [Francisellaceae bacterium]
HVKKEAHKRDENLRKIRRMGRKSWKKHSTYHKRSLAETIMYRLKIGFGSMLRSRKFISQAVEAFIKCNILNKFSSLGLANSKMVD